MWHAVLVNKSRRPVLHDAEHSVYVRDSIGLYHGKLKITNRQHGRIYLTNRRLIYVDSKDQLLSVGVRLGDILRAEPIDGFLRSLAKVKLFLKEKPVGTPAASVQKQETLNWVCLICSFNNHGAGTPDPLKSLPKCVSCGVQTSKAVISKALLRAQKAPEQEPANPKTPMRDDQCAKCTFINHPSMKYCELCGNELRSNVLSHLLQKRLHSSESALFLPDMPIASSESTNPLNIVLDGEEELFSGNKPYIKVSFHSGGETSFYQSLIEQLDKLRWEALVNTGNVNENGAKVDDVAESPPQIKTGGIHNLQSLSEQRRKQNELVLTSSLEDLEQLMYKAQDLIQLSAAFSTLVEPSKILKPHTIIPPLNIKKSSALYHQELARHISEYLMNFELLKSSSMITSQDLFANYNRYLVLTQGFGTQMISPQDFRRSLDLASDLQLPVSLKTYGSGLVVITQGQGQLQHQLHVSVVQFLEKQYQKFRYHKIRQLVLLGQLQAADSDAGEVLGETGDFKTGLYWEEDAYLEEQDSFFRGNTIGEIADNFNWSYSIALEELDTCVAEGVVVIDQNILGTFYFTNQFGAADNNDETELTAKVNADIVHEQRRISRRKWELGQTMDSASSSGTGVSTPVGIHSDLAGLTFE